MSLKAGFLFVMLVVGSYAFPFEDDMSIFLDYTARTARIVGGTTAGHVPYMVALTTGVSSRSLFCAGSLVTIRHVMTAAHCINAVFSEDNLLSSLRGHVDTDRFASGGTSYTFYGNITHPNYTSSLIKNDIGFLITSTDVVLSSTVSLISMNFDFIGAGVVTSVTGWGSTATGGSISQVLLQLSGTVIEGSECVTWVAQRSVELNINNPPPVDPMLEICVFNSNESGTCNGDSGSPLISKDLNQQIGIVSWGLPCARNAPDMFVRLSAYYSFVEQSLSETMAC